MNDTSVNLSVYVKCKHTRCVFGVRVCVCGCFWVCVRTCAYALVYVWCVRACVLGVCVGRVRGVPVRTSEKIVFSPQFMLKTTW